MIRRYAPAGRQIARTVFLAGAMSIAAQAGLHAAEHPLVAPAPLVIDPIFGNAGDRGVPSRRQIAVGGGCMKECISGAAFADVVLNTFFGFNPSVDGGSLVSDPQTPRPFQGTLAGLRYRGQLHQLEASSQGVSIPKDQRAK